MSYPTLSLLSSFLLLVAFLISGALSAAANQGPGNPKMFVVFSYDRAGSNFFLHDLSEKLLQYGVVVHYDLFAPEAVYANPKAKDFYALSTISAEERDANQAKFMVNLKGHTLTGQYWAVGFRVFPKQANQKVSNLWLQNADVVKVLYYREEVLDVYISWLKATHLESGTVGTNTTGQKVDIQQKQFEEFIAVYDLWFDTLKRSSQGPTILVNHKEYTSSPQARAQIAAKLYNTLAEHRNDRKIRVYGPDKVTPGELKGRGTLDIVRQNWGTTRSGIRNLNETLPWLCAKYATRFLDVCAGQGAGG